MRLFIFCMLFHVSLNAQNWEAIGTWNNSINVLYTDSVSNKLIIGGSFRIVNGDTMSGVAQWDGEQLSRMGCGIGWDCSTNLTVNSPHRPYEFLRFNSKLFAVGWFLTVNGVYSPGIAYWDGQSWQPIPGGFETGNLTPSSAEGITVIDDLLYVSGPFSYIQGLTAKNYCVFDGEEFSVPFDFPFYMNSQRIKCIAQFQGINYYAGLFNNATTPTNGDIWNIVKHENGQWLPVGDGIRGGMAGVEKMVVFQDKLYVAGVMSKSAGAPGNAIAAWDGQQWDDVGGGLYQQAEAHIYDMKIYNNGLYVVGTFSSAGGVPVNELAVWDGINWCRFELDVQEHINLISSIEFYNDELYLGGAFWDINNNTIIPRLIRYSGSLEPLLCGNLTGLSSVTENKFNVYPNPSTGLINLSFGKSVKGSITVSNVMGQWLVTQSVMGESSTLDLSSFSSGIYLLRFVDELGNVATEKIIVE